MPTYQLDRSLARDTWKQLDSFTRGYIEAAMWTLTDDDGESLDHLGLHDVHPDTIAAAVADCQAFQEANYADVSEYCIRRRTWINPHMEESAGHDYWLTRNRHGCGFWDRGLGDLGTRLSEAAKADGECNWYVGDDGMVHQM